MGNSQGSHLPEQLDAIKEKERGNLEFTCAEVILQGENSFSWLHLDSQALSNNVLEQKALNLGNLLYYWKSVELDFLSLSKVVALLKLLCRTFIYTPNYGAYFFSMWAALRRRYFDPL